MKRFTILLAAIMFAASAFAASRVYELNSPDGKLSVAVEAGEELAYTLSHDGELLLDKSPLGMYLEDGTVFGGAQPVKKVARRSVNETLQTVVYKKALVKDEYNEMTLKFKKFSVIFRAYDDGMAYRFVSHVKTPYNVEKETVKFNFAEDWNMWAAYVTHNTYSLEGQYFTSNEAQYTYVPLSQWNKDRIAMLPLMVDGPSGKKIVVTEADNRDYPCFYLYNYDEGKELAARFPAFPKELKQGGHNNLQMIVESRESYIAKCEGEQAFPWRIVAVSENDVQMADNDMVYRLAAPADPSADWSWVKPGKVAWDWWNDWNIRGVDFKSGVNNDTYKFYIDFASEYGIEYVILDEGWSVNGAADLFKVVPEIDLQELVTYADSKGVGLILWAGYIAFDRDMEEVCRHYSQMGFKGFKIDFMDRADQDVVDFHTRAAETAAKYHMLVDFHGTYKPVGLHRTYPNVINYEGVHGLENMKWSPASVDQVTYDVTVPYIRMMAGPMDYTQGAMRNATRASYYPSNSEPMSQGTRCRQLAQYVIFDSPLNMLCDSPSNYMQEKECTEYIAAIPTVWDETIGLDGKVGDYIAMARRSGDTWYVGAMTDWDERTLVLDLSFLPEGEYCVEIYRDGVNAHRSGRDYAKECMELPADRKLTAVMAPGGGYAAKLVRKNVK
ncbi:MAG: glycoside hydrolase family 97 protein [Bacteroidales bacterium]|nr:glycoside hydrolase family 97 protein [Bacteroidales bacterium]